MKIDLKILPLLFVGLVSSQSIVDNPDYQTWLSDAKYARFANLSGGKSGDNETSAVMHWSVNETHIDLAVATPGSGWSGFGVAESGSMLGADIVLFSAKDGALKDTFVLDKPETPTADDCQSWTLNNAVMTDGIIIFEASRLLDTGDTQDRPFLDDSDLIKVPNKIIVAWGDDEEPSFHGNNFAKSSVRIFGSESAEQEVARFLQLMEDESEDSFVIAARNFTIPPRETTYQDFCFSRTDLEDAGVPMDVGLHMIGMEPLVDPSATKYVHHFVLSAMTHPWNSTYDCGEYPGIELVYVWAPGALPSNYPSNVGSPLGLDGFESFSLEIHYDNPSMDRDIIDNSGIRIYYTSKKREIDAGMISMADPFVALEGELVAPTGNTVSQHVFDCPSSCSNVFLEEGESVTVFREQLHMHIAGASMTHEMFRDGATVHKSQAQFYDFEEQGGFSPTQDLYEIKAGDSFRSTCDFKPKDGATFGLASSEEMCITFVSYYPRKVIGQEGFPFMCGVGVGEAIPECEASHIATVGFSEVSQIDREFGLASDTCNKPGDETSGNETPTDNTVATSGTDSKESDDSESGDSSSSSRTTSIAVSLVFFIAALMIR